MASKYQDDRQELTRMFGEYMVSTWKYISKIYKGHKIKINILKMKYW